MYVLIPKVPAIPFHLKPGTCEVDVQICKCADVQIEELMYRCKNVDY
jgi:hypothetical protein